MLPLSGFLTSLIVIPSTSDMIAGITYILLTTCLAGQQVNEVFIITSKTMVYFLIFFMMKLLNVSVKPEACNHSKSNTPPWVFLMFFK